MTTTPQQAARDAIEWHKQQEARGEPPWSCRMRIQDDGSVDDGPGGVQCWLIPGHQCDCMTEREARKIAGSTDTDFRPDKLYMSAKTWAAIQNKVKAEAKPTPAQGRSKRARKAQKQARKANRSK